MSDSRLIENLQLEHVRLDKHYIYFNEKIQDLKWRDKQRFVKALNKLIEDFEPRETWQANHSIARRSKVIERLLDKWKDKQ
jgi:arginine repressor